MPQRAKKPCGWKGGCINLVESGLCELHQRKMDDRRRKEQNDDPMRPFYKNSRWVGTRISVLGRYPLCDNCHMMASNVVHHIVDARVWCGRGNDFYDESNLVGWCTECHNRHTATQQHND